ncbi:hypothetical protein L1887_51343 [Cichorium endivia]|nr:hypothetical protein L1887_51343 [Cichorium endivia]
MLQTSGKCEGRVRVRITAVQAADPQNLVVPPRRRTSSHPNACIRSLALNSESIGASGRIHLVARQHERNRIFAYGGWQGRHLRPAGDRVWACASSAVHRAARVGRGGRSQLQGALPGAARALCMASCAAAARVAAAGVAAQGPGDAARSDVDVQLLQLPPLARPPGALHQQGAGVCLVGASGLPTSPGPHVGWRTQYRGCGGHTLSIPRHYARGRRRQGGALCAQLVCRRRWRTQASGCVRSGVCAASRGGGAHRALGHVSAIHANARAQTARDRLEASTERGRCGGRLVAFASGGHRCRPVGYRDADEPARALPHCDCHDDLPRLGTGSFGRHGIRQLGCVRPGAHRRVLARECEPAPRVADRIQAHQLLGGAYGSAQRTARYHVRQVSVQLPDELQDVDEKHAGRMEMRRCTEVDHVRLTEDGVELELRDKLRNGRVEKVVFDAVFVGTGFVRSPSRMAFLEPLRAFYPALDGEVDGARDGVGGGRGGEAGGRRGRRGARAQAREHSRHHEGLQARGRCRYAFGTAKRKGFARKRCLLYLVAADAGESG